LRSLAAADEQVRANKRTEIYEQILAAAQQQQNRLLEETTLKMIAELHLGWFDYPQAAATYKKLRLAKAKNDHVNQVIYLQQLAYIYERLKQYQQAVTVKQQLAEFISMKNSFKYRHCG